MWKMAGNENVASLALQSIAQAPRRIIRLKIGRCRKLRQSIAGTPEGMGRLSRSQFAAVPHHGRPRAAGCRLACGPRRLSLSNR
jgi:hypothetical protein